MNIDRRCDSYSKPPRAKYKQIVQCGGKRGRSVKIEQTSCVKIIDLKEMKVYGTSLLAAKGIYNKLFFYHIL